MRRCFGGADVLRMACARALRVVSEFRRPNASRMANAVDDRPQFRTASPLPHELFRVASTAPHRIGRTHARRATALRGTPRCRLNDATMFPPRDDKRSPRPWSKMISAGPGRNTRELWQVLTAAKVASRLAREDACPNADSKRRFPPQRSRPRREIIAALPRLPPRQAQGAK